MLDDGSALPERKHFLSPSYDEASRTFRATVDWGEQALAGMSRWECEPCRARARLTSCRQHGRVWEGYAPGTGLKHEGTHEES
jgi:hypothetical protein